MINKHICLVDLIGTDFSYLRVFGNIQTQLPCPCKLQLVWSWAIFGQVMALICFAAHSSWFMWYDWYH